MTDPLAQRMRDILNADPRYRCESLDYVFSSTPLLLPPAVYEEICHSTRILNGVLEKVTREICGSARYPDVFRHHAAYAGLNRIEPRHKRLTFLSRFDFILDDRGRIQFIEFNTACPAASLYIGCWRRLAAEILRGDAGDIGRPFILDDEHHVPRKMLDLLSAHYDVGPPAGVFVAKDNCGSTVELELMASRFREEGASADVGSLEDLSYSGGRLRDRAGRRIDLVYCKARPVPSILRGWTPELFERYRPLRAAYEDDAACVLNPFPALTVADDKGILALLTRGDHRGLLSDEEERAVRRHVPETWFVDPADAEQMKRLRAERRDLILKPRMEARCRFIVVGPETSEDAWANALQRAGEDQWVVQRYIDARAASSAHLGEPFHGEAASGSAPSAPLDLGFRTLTVFVVDGEPAGVYARVAPTVANSTSTGGKIQVVFTP